MPAEKLPPAVTTRGPTALAADDMPSGEDLGLTGTGLANVVVTELGREVRRHVGPTAWAVLEELAARLQVDAAGGLAVDVRLGHLADALGLSVEVVRSALRRLIVAGIVERQEQRSADTQRFSGARYRIVARTGLVVVERGSAQPFGDQPGTDFPDTAQPVGEKPHVEIAPADHRRPGVPAPGDDGLSAPGTVPRVAPGRRTRQVAPSQSPQLSLLETTNSEDNAASRAGRRHP